MFVALIGARAHFSLSPANNNPPAHNNQQPATNNQQGDEVVPSGGIITGIGRIHGRLVALVANDATVKGG